MTAICPGQRRFMTAWGLKTYLRFFELLNKLLHCVVSNLHGCHNLYCLHQNLPQFFAETMSPTVPLIFWELFRRNMSPMYLDYWESSNTTCSPILCGFWFDDESVGQHGNHLHRFREVLH